MEIRGNALVHKQALHIKYRDFRVITSIQNLTVHAETFFICCHYFVKYKK